MKTERIKFHILIIFMLCLNPIVIGGQEVFVYLMLYGISSMVILINARYLINNYFRNISVRFVFPILWIIVSLLLSVIVPMIHNTHDYSYVNVVLAIIRRFVIVVFLLIITRKQHKRSESTVELFMLYFSLTTVLYVISTMVFALFPSLRGLWQSILKPSSETVLLMKSYGYTNRFGWDGFAGFRNTIDCTVSLVFLLYLYAGQESRIRIHAIQFVLLGFFCFFGNMFYGRSGIIASTVCLIVGLVLYRIIKPKILFGVGSAIILGVVLIQVFRTRSTAINEWYIWISTPFYNLFTTGSFNNYSANRLLNEMIFIPSHKTLLFGDGKYVDAATGLYYMRTDSGFMRQVLFWGAGITGIMYYCWIKSIILLKRDYRLKILFLFMCIIFEIKGEVYYELMPLFLTFGLIDYKNIKNANEYSVCSCSFPL